jgi:hypothetical protein
LFEVREHGLHEVRREGGHGGTELGADQAGGWLSRGGERGCEVDEAGEGAVFGGQRDGEVAADVDENEEFQGAVEEGEVRAAGVEGAEEDVDVAEDLEWGAEQRKRAEVDWIRDEVREVQI